jgi:CHAT domain-containing protein
VPVHAAGLYDGASQECCSDYFVSSYTPTLTALVRAQQGKCAFAREQVRLLAVAVEHAQDPAMPPLCHVAQEAREIVNAATKAGARSSLDASARTKAEVRTMLESATVVHLACHGIQHESEPHKSHFCLEDGRLSVSELMEMDFKHAFLAFLSACETAKGDFKHADEAVHLAASMLFAGFKSVVATMWCVLRAKISMLIKLIMTYDRAMSDADGPYVAKRFYGKLFEDEAIDVDSVPYALDDAVTALRRTGAPPERWATFVHMGA